MSLTRSMVLILSRVFPDLFVKLAFNRLVNPQVRKLRVREAKVLETAHQEVFRFRDFDIKLYRWDGYKEGILLVHGWEGQAGNFADLILKLQAKGFTIYTFDGPSHGDSSVGETSLFEFADLVGELINKFKVRKLVSHSFGGVATTYALANNPPLEIDRYALITTPDKFRERIEDVANQYGIHPRVVRKLVHKLENKYGVVVGDLNVSVFVQEANVKNAYIIHDRNDQVIPIERSRNVHRHWPQAEFEEVSGTGHFRILRDERVLESVVDFIASIENV